MRSLRLEVAGLLLALAASGAWGVARAQGETAKPAQTPAAKPAQTPANAATMTPAVSRPEPAVLETPDGKLYGTLEVPTRGQAPYPVVLFISGSGPTDRDGNVAGIPGKNNSLKYLAEGLAAEGIASLRYDKRFIGESAGAAKSESDLRFDTYIEDAVLWGRRLRADGRFSQLVVAGHSEGSLVGMVAAQRLPADAFVSIAGAGRRADALMLAQMKPQLPPDLYAKAEAVFKSFAEGKTVADVPADLAALFRASVQPYMISWIKYDPPKELAKLTAPVLVAQGTHDIQVSVEDAKALAAARPDARLLLVEGMNHVLKMTPAERGQQLASYGDPALPVAPKLLAELVAFVKGIKKK
jgi:pimeloyl-ACP methyl ester carboxylesterase